MRFTKMHGLGNDYIYFNCMKQYIEKPGELSKILSDRHFGIGGDGIVLILPSDTCDFRMRMFNSDGSEGKMCGNASRCIGKYVYERGLTDKREILLETLSGVKKLSLTVVEDEVINVDVNMGQAILKSKDIPVVWNKEIVVNEEINIDGNLYNITCVSMGNPHCVIFMDTLDNLNIEELGPKFENNKAFPDRINVEFAEIIDEKTIRMRVWERGSGETFACGTGACATAVAAVLNGYCKKGDKITIKLLGGDLKIRYEESGEVYMSGPAAFVFDGNYLGDI